MRHQSMFQLACLATGSFMALSTLTATAAPQVVEQEMELAKHKLYEVQTQIEATQRRVNFLKAEIDFEKSKPSWSTDEAAQTRVRTMETEASTLKKKIAWLQEQERKIKAYISHLRRSYPG
ncbi:MAG: hypothetical protein ACPGXK_09040 [Phycisphaerae bacterium]